MTHTTRTGDPAETSVRHPVRTAPVVELVETTIAAWSRQARPPAIEEAV
ncbi:hypothetical protein [Xylanimonas sp. McL0601]